MVTTYVRFNRTGNSIDSILWSGGTGTFTPTGATFTPGTYFNLKLLVDRATSNVRICKDGVQIFETTDGSGTTGGNNVSNMVFQQVTGSGQTANNTFFADDLNVTYTPSYNCDGSLPQHTVTSSIGTPAGSISPLGAQSVNEGDSIAFTLTPDAGFRIDTVGGTCAGSLAGDTYTVSNVLADCDVVANFAADIVTHTVTAVVGTGSGTITPPSAVVNDGDTTAFTVTADAGSHIDTVTGCGGTLAGNTYTTGAITSDCTVTANFAVNTTPQPAFFNGALTTSSPTFANPGGSTSGTGVQYYCAQEFTVDTSGSYTLESTSPNTTGTPSSALDTYLRLYANTFNPGSPGAGQASNDDFTGTLTVLPGPYAGTVTATATGFQGTQPGSRITSTLTAGTTYYLVNTSFRSTNYVPTAGEGRPTGPYYTGIGGPGTVTLVGTTCSATTVTHTVTAVVGTGTGTITPPSAVVNEGDTTAFTVTAGSGFHIDTVTGCSGTLAGNTYTTGPVTADCTVTANFAADGANPPSATVTPNSLSFTVREDETGSQTLNIANAAGSNMLTFAITGQASRPARLVPYMTKDRHAHAMLRSTGMRLVRAGGAAHASPAPWSPMGPDGSVTFQADDGSYETSVAWTDAAGTTQNTSLWLNRYTATGALTIDTVSIEWPNAASANGNVTGKTVNVVAYYDADGDGDPSNAVRLGGNTPVTINGPDVFENYPTNFAVPGAGDVYLGFVDTFAAGGTTPVLYSAALDESGNPNLGWVAAMSTGDADVDVLGNNDNIGTLDGLSLGALSGVWMVRGTTTSGGATCAGAAVAWLSASPANGLVAGGANTNVTITANPSADGLAPGSYTAMLCVATNDPAHALIGVPVALTVTPAPVVPCSAADTIFCDGFDPAAGPFTQPIQDPSFEETTDDASSNPYWDGSDSNAPGDTPFWSNLARTGTFAAWGGGWRGPGTQEWSQTVTIASGGPRWLNYWRNVTLAPNGTATLAIAVDGTVVSTTDIVANGTDADWTNVSVDLGAYADNGTHEVKFTYTATGSEDGNCFVDDITIDEQQGSTR